MKRVFRKALPSVVAIVILFVLIDPMLVVVPIKIVWALSMGWTVATARLASGLANFGNRIAFWVLVMFATFVGFHAFLSELRQGWPIRWSFAFFGAIWLALFASMALIGITHQVAVCFIDGGFGVFRENAGIDELQ